MCRDRHLSASCQKKGWQRGRPKENSAIRNEGKCRAATPGGCVCVRTRVRFMDIKTWKQKCTYVNLCLPGHKVHVKVCVLTLHMNLSTPPPSPPPSSPGHHHPNSAQATIDECQFNRLVPVCSGSFSADGRLGCVCLLGQGSVYLNTPSVVVL